MTNEGTKQQVFVVPPPSRIKGALALAGGLLLISGLLALPLASDDPVRVLQSWKMWAFWSLILFIFQDDLKRAYKDTFGLRRPLTISEDGMVGAQLRRPVLWKEVEDVQFETDRSGSAVRLRFISPQRAREVRVSTAEWWLQPLARWVKHTEAVVYLNGYDEDSVVDALKICVPEGKSEYL